MTFFLRIILFFILFHPRKHLLESSRPHILLGNVIELKIINNYLRLFIPVYPTIVVVVVVVGRSARYIYMHVIVV